MRRLAVGFASRVGGESSDDGAGDSADDGPGPSAAESDTEERAAHGGGDFGDLARLFRPRRGRRSVLHGGAHTRDYTTSSPQSQVFFRGNFSGGSGNFRRRAAALIIRPMLQSLTTFPRAARTDAPPPIDFAFPEDEADALARMEAFNKHLFRPNTYLHKWWARRCGTTFRRILKALADDPAGRDFYAPGGLEGAIVLDPMMGGGTTLHEALRMGAKVVGCDIDPIPVLQAKASLSPSDLTSRARVFDDFLAELRGEAARFFQTACPRCGRDSEALYFLHGSKRSLNGEEILTVDNLLLREEKENNGKRSVLLTDFYPGRTIRVDNRQRRLVEKSEVRRRKGADKNADAPYPSRFAMLAVVGECAKCGQFHKKPDSRDRAAAEAARDELSKIADELPNGDLVADGPKSGDLLRNGIRRYSELFSPRQLICLARAKSALSRAPEADRTWLALLISASLEFNSMLCGFKGGTHWRAGAIRHVFSHHAYSFPHTALENNPLFPGRASGTLRQLFERRIRAAGEWAKRPIERVRVNGAWAKIPIDGEADSGRECASFSELADCERGFVAEQRDSAVLDIPDGAVDFVVTDPPYYDSVQYGDLSGFFRCWLEWLLPGAADWRYRADSAAVAGNGSNGRFRRGLENIWRECARVLARPNGRLIFTYHHWRADAWAEMAIALRSAGFRLRAHYAVQSESKQSVHIRDLDALMHDSILVLSPDDGAKGREWIPPKTMPRESRAFCRACADMLGWSLESEKSNDAIAAAWRTALEKRKQK